MRILFVGYLGRGQTSGMRRAALERLGHDVVAVEASDVWKGASYLTRQLGERSARGTRVDKLNESVLHAAARQSPTLVWAEKQEYLRPDTIRRLQAQGAVALHYNPDPYFSLDWKRTSVADECIRLYDALVVTKRYEMDEYGRYASGQVIYSPLGYDPIAHAPPRSSLTNQGQRVVFVGGWEPRRERLLHTAMEVTPEVAIWGYGWSIAQGSRMNPLRALRLGRLAPSSFYVGERDQSLRPALRKGEGSNGEIYEDRYAQAIAGSHIALGFLRELWPDQHTTRTFEIPAIGGFMLADRTEEHLSFFEEGREAEFFSSDEEYREKVSFYLSNDSTRQRIALLGHARCISSGYSYDERIRAVLSELKL
jgi:spore maturation protein CgeB